MLYKMGRFNSYGERIFLVDDFYLTWTVNFIIITIIMKAYGIISNSYNAVFLIELDEYSVH